MGIGPHSSCVLFVVLTLFAHCIELFVFHAARMSVNICICIRSTLRIIQASTVLMGITGSNVPDVLSVVAVGTFLDLLVLQKRSATTG